MAKLMRSMLSAAQEYKTRLERVNVLTIGSDWAIMVMLVVRLTHHRFGLRSISRISQNGTDKTKREKARAD